ncbi:MAG TPA: glycosyltransferase [Bacteroidales bacterium]
MSRPVSLIISFYNKIDQLRFVLTALERQTYTNFEVLIADDGSKPEVVKEITELKSNYSFPIKHIWHEDKGWQKNRILNKAVVASEGEYLIFIDGDCIPHPKFIQEHVENRVRNQVITGRRVLLSESVSKKLTLDKIRNGYLDRRVAIPLIFESLFQGTDTQVENLLRIRNKILRKLFIKDKIRGFWGCNFSIWKKDILKVNGFDERYVFPGFGEDCDLDDRLRRIGIFPISKKHLVTEYHIYHVHFATMHEENLRLYNEKKVNNEKYTPYGIIKDGKIPE